MAYAVPLRSPYSHARILSIDSSRAAKLPGVLGLLHRNNLAGLGLNLEWKVGDQNFITIDNARFDGDLIGMVVAVDLRTARHAPELIKVEYEILPPIFSADTALALGAPLIHEQLGANLAVQDEFEWGEINRGFKEAERVFEDAFTSQTVYHHPMEPAIKPMAALNIEVPAPQLPR